MPVSALSATLAVDECSKRCGGGGGGGGMAMYLFILASVLPVL